MNKVFYPTLLVLLFSITGCTSKKEKLEIAIQEFYTMSNTHTGGGTSKISTIDIIEVEEKEVTALISGSYHNNSTPKPESGDFSDTLIFGYEKMDNGYKIISIAEK